MPTNPLDGAMLGLLIALGVLGISMLVGLLLMCCDSDWLRGGANIDCIWRQEKKP